MASIQSTQAQKGKLRYLAFSLSLCFSDRCRFVSILLISTTTSYYSSASRLFISAFYPSSINFSTCSGYSICFSIATITRPQSHQHRRLVNPRRHLDRRPLRDPGCRPLSKSKNKRLELHSFFLHHQAWHQE
ncbi:hypothetical protein LguiA_010354 [Lonicera macranthoides]